MVSNQPRRGARHGLGIEHAGYLPGAVKIERKRRSAVDDAVMIDACDGRTPGIEIICRIFRRQNGNPMRPQMCVQRVTQLFRLGRAPEIEMAGLAQGMDPGIRPPGAMHPHRLATKCGNRLLKRLLDRKAIGLPLPADEFRAVIFEG